MTSLNLEQVILTWEKHWLRAFKTRSRFSRLAARLLSPWCFFLHASEPQSPFPRWLHVLVPIDTNARRKASTTSTSGSTISAAKDEPLRESSGTLARFTPVSPSLHSSPLSCIGEWMASQLSNLNQCVESALAVHTAETKRALTELAAQVHNLTPRFCDFHSTYNPLITTHHNSQHLTTHRDASQHTTRPRIIQSSPAFPTHRVRPALLTMPPCSTHTTCDLQARSGGASGAVMPHGGVSNKGAPPRASEALPPGASLFGVAMAAKRIGPDAVKANASERLMRLTPSLAVAKPLEPQDAKRGASSHPRQRAAAPPAADVEAIVPIWKAENAPPVPAANEEKEVSLGGWHGQLPLPLPVSASTHPQPDAPVSALLNELLGGRAADMDRARLAARRLRDPAYTLRMFHDDVVAAFPELSLYMVTVPTPAAGDSGAAEATSSGISAKDEYLRTMLRMPHMPPVPTTYVVHALHAPFTHRTCRALRMRAGTIGALFAFYWIMRIGIDGEVGFTYGVDVSWRVAQSDDAATRVPLSEPRQPIVASSEFFALTSEEKQRQFLESTHWDELLDLLCNAGLLTRAAGSDDGADVYTVDVERTLAMLVLTAVHDIMKVELLMPTVQQVHAPYQGFTAGERIHDHDQALGYVLDFYGGSLPSFDALLPEQRRVVRFTQARLGFNHGWLVQVRVQQGSSSSFTSVHVSSRVRCACRRRRHLGRCSRVSRRY